MRYIQFLAVSALSFFPLSVLLAQTRQKVNLEQATVFLKGAELMSSAKMNIGAGETEVLFTNIAGNINEQSITVVADKDVAVQSATFQNNYLEPESISPKAKEIKDSIEKLKDNRQLTDNKLSVIKEQLAVIQENHKVGGNANGLSVAELQRTLDLINAKMGLLLDEKIRLENKLRTTDELLTKLQNQYNEEQKKGIQPGGQLLVRFFSKDAVASNVIITYVVPNAGWNPSYDLRVNDISAPVKLFYKANVFQNCGIKWDHVHVLLSTGNPNEGAQAPMFTPWHLALRTTAASNLRTAEEIDKMPTRDTRDIAASAPGVYKSSRGADLNISGGRSDGNVYIVDGAVVQAQSTTMNDHVSVDNTGINTTFEIDIPYTIPTDGQQHLVAIKTYEMPASYRYFAIPKMDKDAFLQAQITKWEDLNLLPAKTNIFYEGAYVGQGNINIHDATDTMILSLGRDKKIVVKREQDKELKSIKTIGSNVRETVAYTNTVRNTRKQAVDLILLEQIPVSNDKDIVIEEPQTEGAEYNEASGEVKWKIHLEANESKKLKFGYTVKYPKGRTINNLR